MTTRLWRVYGSAPPPVTRRSRRAVLRVANRYARLGILSAYYYMDDGGEWVRWHADEADPVIPGPAEGSRP